MSAHSRTGGTGEGQLAVSQHPEWRGAADLGRRFPKNNGASAATELARSSPSTPRRCIMKRLLLPGLLLSVLGCVAPAERVALQPLPETGQVLPYAELLTRVRAQANAANEAFYLDRWGDLRRSGQGHRADGPFYGQGARSARQEQGHTPRSDAATWPRARSSSRKLPPPKTSRTPPRRCNKSIQRYASCA